MISIVVPVYNAAAFIDKTIDTVVSQTFRDWELILVDDCSKDNSCELIDTYIREHTEVASKIRLIKQEKNAGAAAARNRGIDEAKGRYIAFLDADDLWYPDKLAKEMLYMQKHSAGFVFTAYEFGDENAVPTGKIVRVPKTLNYKEALSRTIIFTSTVLLDTEKVDKSLIHMPLVGSEDTATWWQILKNGVTAYGLNNPLVIYRRPASSLSSNKKVAIKRVWNLYRSIAGLSAPMAALYMLRWAWHATERRIVDDGFRSHVESFKRFTVVQLSLIGLLLHTAVYAAAWFRKLYPFLSTERISQDGFSIGIGIKLYFRGHILILLVYFVLLLFLSSTSGSMKTGYLKPGNIFSSEATALLLTNALTYFQLSLIRNWLIPSGPIVFMTLAQLVIAAVWAYLSDLIYRHVFPPRETLVVSLSGDSARLAEKFSGRKDRFKIMKTIRFEGDLESIESECLRWYGCVVISGGSESLRKNLLQFCYSHYIRVYLEPDIGDLLLQESEVTDLFDSPVLELKEYSVRWEARVIKRAFDLLLSLIALTICLPFFLYRKIRNDRIITDQCSGKDGNAFFRYRYETSSWKIPELVNVLNGSMSFVGPEARTCEQAEQEIDTDNRYFYRYRVKPGLIGYAQLYSGADTQKIDMLKMDISYIQHFSLLNDFKLLLQSMRVRKI